MRKILESLSAIDLVLMITIKKFFLKLSINSIYVEHVTSLKTNRNVKPSIRLLLEVFSNTGPKFGIQMDPQLSVDLKTFKKAVLSGFYTNSLFHIMK